MTVTEEAVYPHRSLETGGTQAAQGHTGERQCWSGGRGSKSVYCSFPGTNGKSGCGPAGLNDFSRLGGLGAVPSCLVLTRVRTGKGGS